MKKLSRLALVPVFALPSLVGVACGGSSPTADAGRAGDGSSGAAQAGTVAQAGTTDRGGGSPAGGGGASAVAVGGAGSAGSAGSGGATPSGGAFAIGGNAGEATGAGGGGGASTPGGSGGAGGGDATLAVAQALDGLRVDDPCAGTPDTSSGAVCNHVVLTNGGFKSAKNVTIAGATGTTYDVTLRIRGIVEPTQIDGGTRPDTSTFKYQNMTWRKVPFTIGGTVSHADYSQWRISVENPKQEYYLNDYQTVGHYIFALDYQVTIQIAANSKVTLDGTDSNEREIVNYEKYTIDGIPGSMNFGQFIQCNLVAVKAH